MIKDRFTDYMNKSLKFRKQLIKYCIGADYEAEVSRRVLDLLDKADHRAEKDETFRSEFYLWLRSMNGYSTIKLRELCKQIGCDYWTSLENSEYIDTFDTVSAINWKTN